MFYSSFVRKLCDTIINGKPLSYGQLFFLVYIVADYMHDYDRDCYDDFCRAKLSLLQRINY